MKPKGDNPTPRECDITGRRLSGITGLPSVFILHPGPTYERQRLMDKGVYFIMSERYAYLPMVVALEKNGKQEESYGLNACCPISFTLSSWGRQHRGLVSKWDSPPCSLFLCQCHFRHNLPDRFGILQETSARATQQGGAFWTERIWPLETSTALSPVTCRQACLLWQTEWNRGSNMRDQCAGSLYDAQLWKRTDGDDDKGWI